MKHHPVVYAENLLKLMMNTSIININITLIIAYTVQIAQ
jgi:hypothetical protein